MRSIVIYHSEHHGNTQKVARVIAEVLEATLLDISQFDFNSIENLMEKVFKGTLIGLGSGIYWGIHHEGLFKLVDALPADFKANFFIFSTSGTGKLSYHKELREKINQRGWEVTGEFACLGFDTEIDPAGINKSKPDNEDLKNAREFAGSLKES